MMNKEQTKELLISEILLSNESQISTETKDLIATLQNQRIRKPIIFIGMGTCGIVAGAKKTLSAIKEYLHENNIDADIVETGCIGLCSSEPLVDVQLPGKSRISFEKVNPDNVSLILDSILNHIIPFDNLLGQYVNQVHQSWDKAPDINKLPYFSHQNKLILKNCGIIDPKRIESYISIGGYKSLTKTFRNHTSDEICSIVELSGLRGRGGGGFSTGKKWKYALESQGFPRYLICNADESDPGAFMDRALIEGNPHLLIEGIAIAAYAIGASKAFIYIRSDYQTAIKQLSLAIEQAHEYGLLGDNIVDSGHNLEIIVRIGAGAFVCGEETALINSLEGKRGTARPKPPYPAVQGYLGKPTVVNNVETLANIPIIIEKGAAWYKTIGTLNSSGTKVFALSGKTVRSGLIEVSMGTSIKTIVQDIAGGIKQHNQFKALLIGGPSGCLITKDQLNVTIDYDEFASKNLIMGSGGMVVMDEFTCMVDIAKYLISFLQRESCGKCIPCRDGTQRIREILEQITQRPEKSNPNQTLERFKGILELESMAEVIKDTSLCGLGKTAANPILSSLKHFREEFEEHIFDRKCRAGICRDLQAYYIEVDKCIGCTICSKKCPANAIIGTVKNPHFIVVDKCTGCGICFTSCKFGAVSTK